MSATINVNFGQAVPAFFSWLFFGKEAKKLKYDIVFGSAAAGLGEHGTLIGTWVKEGYRQPFAIPFYIKGFKMAPRMDLELMKEIYHHAGMVGIIPSHLHTYAGLYSAQKPQI